MTQKKSKTADKALFDDFLPHLIARLAYQLNNDLIEKLRLEGINVTRWRILAVLAMGDGITINEIIDRAMMQQSALSRALMNMEEEEYVRREVRGPPRNDDERNREIQDFLRRGIEGEGIEAIECGEGGPLFPF